MNGLELAQQIRTRLPAIAVVLLSAAPPATVADHACIDEFLIKPFSPRELRRSAAAHLWGHPA